MADLRPTLGDPIFVSSYGGTVVWRYLTHGGGTFTDVIVKNNVAQSVTVLGRFKSVDFTDPNGITFGLTPDEVRTKLGPAVRESTNSDDGSLDLTYRSLPYGWVYEFHANKLDFIQLLAGQSILNSLTPGPPATPNDGTSRERAIWIRPSVVVSNTLWIDTYLAHADCGSGGHWKSATQEFLPDSATHDPMAIMVVHAQCSAGQDRRDFFFDTHGSLTAQKGNQTMYVDVRQLAEVTSSAAASPAPQAPDANQITFSAHDVATLIRATEDAEKSPKITLQLRAKGPAEMPAYDPVAHFAGIDPASKEALIWMVQPYPAKTADGAWALRSALELACMATGFAGPQWKAIYDRLAAEDAALPADTPNPYKNRLSLTAQVRKIFESYLPQH
jgi:hypothetical protein